jgi:tetrathionate reductase subunit B
MERRRFLWKSLAIAAQGTLIAGMFRKAHAAPADYDPTKHDYGMGIQVDKCIGCGRCVEACKTENDVPKEPFFFRTWVERYVIRTNN